MPLYLNGTDGVYGVNGTTAKPAVRGTDETGNGIFYGTDTVSVATNGTTAVTVDSSQNVGIGTASPAFKLDVSGGINSTISGKSAQLNAAGGSIYASFADGTKTWRIGNGIISAGLFSLFNATDAITAFSVNSAGEVLCGGTTDNGAYNLQCNGTAVWGAGAYVNGSDERIKDNIQNIASCTDVVMALRPVTFQYKPEFSKDTNIQPGFIAQDLQQALAGQVYEAGVVMEGPEYLSVAYQSLIPVLTKAIQELSAKLDAAEARIAALEAK
jgi:hypothetical protein